MKPELEWITARPIAHRGLHNIDEAIYENTLSSCNAAIERGFNIEVDLQPAGDGKSVIFHDLTLERMSGDPGNVRQLNSAQLREVKIGKSRDHIATLDELLELTNGKTGLILEMKGVVSEDDGFVESIAGSLKNYDGPVAIMSFYHWLLRDARNLARQLPGVALGLIAKDNDVHYNSHKMIADECNVDFVSYKCKDLPCKFANEFRNSGKPLICWTVKTPEQMADALRYCDQVTFEGFDPDHV